MAEETKKEEAQEQDSKGTTASTTTTKTEGGASSTEVLTAFATLDSEIADLNAQRVGTSVSAPRDAKFYKLVDTDRVTQAMKSDSSLYDPKRDSDRGGYTKKGRRRLEALGAIEKAQEQGYRFVPVKGGGFTILSPEGRPLSRKDSPVEGHSSFDKNIGSWVSGDSARHKAVSNVIGNAMNFGYYKEDPTFTKSQEEYDTIDDLEGKLGQLQQRRAELEAFYNQGMKDGTKTTTINNNTIGGSSGGGNNGEEQSVTGEDTGDDTDLIDSLKEVEPGTGVQAELNLGWVWDAESVLEAGALGTLAAGAAMKSGKTSTYLLGASGLADTFAAALSDDRSVWAAGLENLGVIAFSSLGMDKQARTKMARSVAKAIARKPRAALKYAGWIEKALKVGVGVAGVGAFAGATASTIDTLAEMRRKYEHGEEINEKDAIRLFNAITKGFIIGKTFAKGVGKKSTKPTTKSKKTATKTEVKPKAEVKPTPKPEPKAEPKAAPTPEAKPAPTPAPKPSAKVKPDATKSARKSKDTNTKNTPRPTTRKPKASETATKSVENYRMKRREDGGIVYEVHSSVLDTFRSSLQLFTNGGKLVPKAQGGDIFSLDSITNAYAPVQGNVPYASGPAPQTAYAGNVPYNSGMSPQLSSTLPGESPTVDWNLGDEPIDTQDFPFVYQVTKPVNWKDVRDNGAEPSAQTKRFYLDKNNPNDLVTEDDLGSYLQKNYPGEFNDYEARHMDDSQRAPIVSMTGVAGVPYGVISDLILNKISSENIKDVEYADVKKTPLMPNQRFAAMSMPWEVEQQQRNNVMSQARSSELMSSDPIANAEQSRRINDMSLRSLNQLSTDVAKWNMDQIIRQQDQERADNRDIAMQKAAQVGVENVNIQGRLAADNANAKMEVEARQAYLNQIGNSLRETFNSFISRANPIANAEYQENTAELGRLEQRLNAEYAREDGFDRGVVDDLLAQIKALSGDRVMTERIRQGGPKFKRGELNRGIDPNLILDWE